MSQFNFDVNVSFRDANNTLKKLMTNTVSQLDSLDRVKKHVTDNKMLTAGSAKFDPGKAGSTAQLAYQSAINEVIKQAQLFGDIQRDSDSRIAEALETVVEGKNSRNPEKLKEKLGEAVGLLRTEVKDLGEARKVLANGVLDAINDSKFLSTNTDYQSSLGALNKAYKDDAELIAKQFSEFRKRATGAGLTDGQIQHLQQAISSGTGFSSTAASESEFNAFAREAAKVREDLIRQTAREIRDFDRGLRSMINGFSADSPEMRELAGQVQNIGNHAAFKSGAALNKLIPMLKASLSRAGVTGRNLETVFDHLYQSLDNTTDMATQSIQANQIFSLAAKRARHLVQQATAQGLTGTDLSAFVTQGMMDLNIQEEMAQQATQESIRRGNEESRLNGFRNTARMFGLDENNHDVLSQLGETGLMNTVENFRGLMVNTFANMIAGIATEVFMNLGMKLAESYKQVGELRKQLEQFPEPKNIDQLQNAALGAAAGFENGLQTATGFVKQLKEMGTSADVSVQVLERLASAARNSGTDLNKTTEAYLTMVQATGNGSSSDVARGVGVFAQNHVNEGLAAEKYSQLASSQEAVTLSYQEMIVLSAYYAKQNMAVGDSLTALQRDLAAAKSSIDNTEAPMKTASDGAAGLSEQWTRFLASLKGGEFDELFRGMSLVASGVITVLQHVNDVMVSVNEIFGGATGNVLSLIGAFGSLAAGFGALSYVNSQAGELKGTLETIAELLSKGGQNARGGAAEVTAAMDEESSSIADVRGELGELGDAASTAHERASERASAAATNAGQASSGGFVRGVTQGLRRRTWQIAAATSRLFMAAIPIVNWLLLGSTIVSTVWNAIRGRSEKLQKDAEKAAAAAAAEQEAIRKKQEALDKGKDTMNEVLNGDWSSESLSQYLSGELDNRIKALGLNVENVRQDFKAMVDAAKELGSPIAGVVEQASKLAAEVEATKAAFDEFQKYKKENTELKLQGGSSLFNAYFEKEATDDAYLEAFNKMNGTMQQAFASSEKGNQLINQGNIYSHNVEKNTATLVNQKQPGAGSVSAERGLTGLRADPNAPVARNNREADDQEAKNATALAAFFTWWRDEKEGGKARSIFGGEIKTLLKELGIGSVEEAVRLPPDKILERLNRTVTNREALIRENDKRINAIVNRNGKKPSAQEYKDIATWREQNAAALKMIEKYKELAAQLKNILANTKVARPDLVARISDEKFDPNLALDAVQKDNSGSDVAPFEVTSRNWRHWWEKSGMILKADSRSKMNQDPEFRKVLLNAQKHGLVGTNVAEEAAFYQIMKDRDTQRRAYNTAINEAKAEAKKRGLTISNAEAFARAQIKAYVGSFKFGEKGFKTLEDLYTSPQAQQAIWTRFVTENGKKVKKMVYSNKRPSGNGWVKGESIASQLTRNDYVNAGYGGRSIQQPAGSQQPAAAPKPNTVPTPSSSKPLSQKEVLDAMGIGNYKLNFGYKDPNYNYNGQTHYGEDYNTPVGTPIMAPFNGTVSVKRDKYLGLNVFITDAQGNSIRAGHLSGVQGELNGLINSAQTMKVTMGTLLGWTGGDPKDKLNSGNTTGPHVDVSYYRAGQSRVWTSASSPKDVKFVSGMPDQQKEKLVRDSGGNIITPKLNGLNPEFKQTLEGVMQQYQQNNKNGLVPFIKEGYRTAAEQARLYQIGRDKNGKPLKVDPKTGQPLGTVTNSKPGESIHQYGVAADIYWRDPVTGKVVSFTDPRAKAAAEALGKLASSKGLLWGGTPGWGGPTDLPHVQEDVSAYEAQQKYVFGNTNPSASTGTSSAPPAPYTPVVMTNTQVKQVQTVREKMMNELHTANIGKMLGDIEQQLTDGELDIDERLARKKAALEAAYNKNKVGKSYAEQTRLYGEMQEEIDDLGDKAALEKQQLRVNLMQQMYDKELNAVKQVFKNSATFKKLFGAGREDEIARIYMIEKQNALRKEKIKYTDLKSTVDKPKEPKQNDFDAQLAKLIGVRDDQLRVKETDPMTAALQNFEDELRAGKDSGTIQMAEKEFARLFALVKRLKLVTADVNTFRKAVESGLDARQILEPTERIVSSLDFLGESLKDQQDEYARYLESFKKAKPGSDDQAFFRARLQAAASNGDFLRAEEKKLREEAAKSLQSQLVSAQSTARTVLGEFKQIKTGIYSVGNEYKGMFLNYRQGVDEISDAYKQSVKLATAMGKSGVTAAELANAAMKGYNTALKTHLDLLGKIDQARNSLREAQVADDMSAFTRGIESGSAEIIKSFVSGMLKNPKVQMMLDPQSGVMSAGLVKPILDSLAQTGKPKTDVEEAVLKGLPSLFNLIQTTFGEGSDIQKLGDTLGLVAGKGTFSMTDKDGKQVTGQQVYAQAKKLFDDLTAKQKKADPKDPLTETDKLFMQFFKGDGAPVLDALKGSTVNLEDGLRQLYGLLEQTAFKRFDTALRDLSPANAAAMDAQQDANGARIRAERAAGTQSLASEKMNNVASGLEEGDLGAAISEYSASVRAQVSAELDSLNEQLRVFELTPGNDKAYKQGHAELVAKRDMAQKAVDNVQLTIDQAVANALQSRISYYTGLADEINFTDDRMSGTQLAELPEMQKKLTDFISKIGAERGTVSKIVNPTLRAQADQNITNAVRNLTGRLGESVATVVNGQLESVDRQLSELDAAFARNPNMDPQQYAASVDSVMNQMVGLLTLVETLDKDSAQRQTLLDTLNGRVAALGLKTRDTYSKASVESAQRSLDTAETSGNQPQIYQAMGTLLNAKNSRLATLKEQIEDKGLKPEDVHRITDEIKSLGGEIDGLKKRYEDLGQSLDFDTLRSQIPAVDEMRRAIVDLSESYSEFATSGKKDSATLQQAIMGLFNTRRQLAEARDLPIIGTAFANDKRNFDIRRQRVMQDIALANQLSSLAQAGNFEEFSKAFSVFGTATPITMAAFKSGAMFTEEMKKNLKDFRLEELRREAERMNRMFEEIAGTIRSGLKDVISIPRKMQEENRKLEESMREKKSEVGVNLINQGQIQREIDRLKAQRDAATQQVDYETAVKGIASWEEKLVQLRMEYEGLNAQMRTAQEEAKSFGDMMLESMQGVMDKFGEMLDGMLANQLMVGLFGKSVDDGSGSPLDLWKSFLQRGNTPDTKVNDPLSDAMKALEQSPLGQAFSQGVGKMGDAMKVWISNLPGGEGLMNEMGNIGNHFSELFSGGTPEGGALGFAGDKISGLLGGTVIEPQGSDLNLGEASNMFGVSYGKALGDYGVMSNTTAYDMTDQITGAIRESASKTGGGGNPLAGILGGFDPASILLNIGLQFGMMALGNIIDKITNSGEKRKGFSTEKDLTAGTKNPNRVTVNITTKSEAAIRREADKAVGRGLRKARYFD